jgi:hypothetical protein
MMFFVHMQGTATSSGIEEINPGEGMYPRLWVTFAHAAASKDPV